MVKTHSFVKAQKTQTKVAVRQVLDFMLEDSDSDSANETEAVMEQDPDATLSI